MRSLLSIIIWYLLVYPFYQVSLIGTVVKDDDLEIVIQPHYLVNVLKRSYRDDLVVVWIYSPSNAVVSSICICCSYAGLPFFPHGCSNSASIALQIPRSVA